MGAVAVLVEAFLEATSGRFIDRVLVDKVSDGFTVSVEMASDKAQTLSTVSTAVFQHRLIWVGGGENQFNSGGMNRLAIYAAAAGRALQGPVGHASIKRA